MSRLLIAFVGLLAAGATAMAADQKPLQVEEILRSTTTSIGQPIRLPSQGTEVVASLYTIAPGAQLLVHKHPYPRYAYVLSGVLNVIEEKTAKVVTYAPGDFIIEMTGEWHWGANAGEGPVQLLVIDQAEPGMSNTMLKSSGQ